MRSTLAAFFMIIIFFFAASFLIPYIICLVFCGIPIFYLEVALGQYVGQGVVGAWAAICPFLGGKWFKCYAHAHLLMVPSRNQTLTPNSFIAHPSPQKFSLICWEIIVWQLFIRRNKSNNLSHWRKSSFSHDVDAKLITETLFPFYVCIWRHNGHIVVSTSKPSISKFCLSF